MRIERLLCDQDFKILNSIISQDVDKCYSYIKVYPFPLVDILMQLYLECDLNEDFHSIVHLNKLFNEYKKNNPSFRYSKDDIIENGWIATFLDRWELTVYKYDIVQKLKPSESDYYDILEFLNWLSEQEKQSKLVIVLRNVAEILKKWQQLCQETPNIEWFIENRFIIKDEDIYYAYSNNIGDRIVCEALAKMWVYNHNSKKEDTIKRWFIIARELKPSWRILEYYEYKDKQEFLIKIVEMFIDSHYVVDAKREEKTIEKLYWLKNSKLLKEKRSLDLFTSNLLVEKLQYYESASYYDLSSHLYKRREDIYFLIGCLMNYLNVLPEENYAKIIPAFCNLHEAGVFEYYNINNLESLIELCSYGETQFIGFQLLLQCAMSKNLEFLEQFANCFIKLLINIMDSRGLYDSGLNARALAQLLHLCAEGSIIGSESVNTKISRVYKEILTMIVSEVVKYPFQLKKMLPTIVNYFDVMCKQKHDVSWVRAFHLVSLCMNNWFYGQNALEKDENYKKMQSILINCYYSIFECSEQRKASFISEKLLFDDVWGDIYDEIIFDLTTEEKIKFLKPIKISKDIENCDNEHIDRENKKINLRHQFNINLNILSILLNKNIEDQLIKNSLVDILTSFINNNDDLFDYSSIYIFKYDSVMKKCISLIDAEDRTFRKFIDQLEKYSVPKLLLFLHYSINEELSKKLYELIISKIEPECMDVYGNEQAIYLAIEYKIEELYPHIETLLINYLDRIKEIEDLGIEKSRRDAYNQLNYLYYCWEKYDEILNGSNLFYKALVYINSNEHRDLDEAEHIGYGIISNREIECVGAYINLLCTHILQIENAIKERNKELINIFQNKIIQLSKIIENNGLLNWDEEDKICYCTNMIRVKKLLGEDIKEYIQELNKKFKLQLELEQYEEAYISTCIENREIDDDDLEKYLLKYKNMNSMAKSRLYYKLKSIPDLQDANETFILECIIRTCYSIEAYGPQLAVAQNKQEKNSDKENIEWKFYEDNITQLYREMFNLAFTDLHNLAINDQEQTGSTGKAVHNGMKKGSSEVDLTIKQENIRVGILEALVLEKFNRNKIKDHVYKAVGNNIQNCVINVVLIYGVSSKAGELWNQYKKYVHIEMAEMLDHKGYKVSFIGDFAESPYYDEEIFKKIPFTKNILYESFINPNGMEQHLYHIYLDISKDSEANLRLDK